MLERFGDGFARHFFVPYNRKLFRARAEELSLDWVGRYVPQPTLEDVIDGALGLHERPVGYNATFRYPRSGGIRLLPDAVASGCPGSTWRAGSWSSTSASAGSSWRTAGACASTAWSARWRCRRSST